MYTPRTLSYRVRLARSLASRRVRKVLIVVGQPRLRTTAFQVFEGLRVMVVNTFPGAHSGRAFPERTE